MDNEFQIRKDTLEIVQTREFNAPRELVWKAMTDPELIVQWWGPSILTTEVEKDEVQVGGKWRYIHTEKNGTSYAFRGEYLEVQPPEKIVRTFEYEPMAGHILTETMQLTEENGKTTLVSTSKYANIEDLEGMVASGMEGGARESMERLSLLVEKMKGEQV